MKPLFVEWKRFLPSQLSDTMLANIANNKRQWQGVEEKGGLARPTKLPLSPSPGVSSSCGDRARDGNANNATTATTTTAAKQVDEAEMEEEEEEEGEEEDTLENDVNLAFHYQTDSELRSGDGTYTLPPMSEEEQLRRLALNTRRRHSMPVAVRKDLGFYLGLQRDGLAASGSGSGSGFGSGLGAVPGYLRRQSLPVAPVLTSMLDPVLGKDLCVDKLRARPKIFNLSSALGTGTPHPPPFIHRLQQGGEGGGLGPGDDHPDTALLPPPRPRQMSASCVELQRDLEGLRSGVMGHGGHRGFASSWPNVTQAGRQMKQDDVDSDLLLQRPDRPSHQGSSHSRNSEPGDSGSDRDVSAGVSTPSIPPGDSGSDRDVSAGVSTPSVLPGDSGSDHDVSAGVSTPSVLPGDSGSDRDVSAGVSTPSVLPGDSGSDRDVSAGVSTPSVLPGDSGSDRDVSAGVSTPSVLPGDSGSDRDVSAGVSTPSVLPGDSGSDRDVSAGVSSPCSVTLTDSL